MKTGKAEAGNNILSLDSKCVLLRCSLNKLNLQTNAVPESWKIEKVFKQLIRQEMFPFKGKE